MLGFPCIYLLSSELWLLFSKFCFCLCVGVAVLVGLSTVCGLHQTGKKNCVPRKTFTYNITFNKKKYIYIYSCEAFTRL